MKKKALIFGITGQDGSYLAEFLIKKNYQVHGVKRRSSSFNSQRIEHFYRDYQKPSEKIEVTDFSKNFVPHFGDVTDSTNVIRLVQLVKPDEIYNLAAQSHVQVSFETPEYTANTDALGTLRILEAIRILKLRKKTKFYQASTSELYGNSPPPQSEKTPFKPQSPYAVAKLYAYWITVNYRQAYGIFACNGILFNHEGPRRGETFVSRKITRAVAEIYNKKRKFFYLGNLYAKRDWGSAKDYVVSMWKMLQKKQPDDYVISTGKSYSVKQFVEEAFNQINIKISWRGKGLDEVGYDKKTKNILVKIDKNYIRPVDVMNLKGNYKKAREELNWIPGTSFKSLVKEMLIEDIKKTRN